jgi:coiled-coil domain-containing protein 12
MEKKLARLDRKTQEAIHTLIRMSCLHSYMVQCSVRRLIDPFLGQRLAAQKGQSDDLVGAMRAQESANVDEDDEED